MPDLQLEVRDDRILLPVRVQPKASANRIGGVHNGALKVSVTAPPEKGKANAAVIKLLAKALHVATSSVELVAGEASRNKKLRVPAAVGAEAIRQLAGP